mmetsp:Transcript_28058/g.70446  ORF Transcript_28058/g.70446 Transcript_28058/m.70446 type:complete len:233 (+) Transcript_28058:889-1587(+)
MAELRLLVVRCARLVAWADKAVGHRQHGHDGQDLVGALVVGALHEQLGELGVQRKLCHQFSCRQELSLVVKRAQVVQLLEGPHHCLWRWRVHEVKVHKVGDAELVQVEHDRPQVGPQDLGVRLLNQVLLEGVFGVEAERLSGARTAGTTGPLLGRRSGDRGHQQRLHANARVVHFLLGEAGVDDVHDAVNGERRFRDVGGYDALASPGATRHTRRGGGFEDPLLLLGGQTSV